MLKDILEFVEQQTTKAIQEKTSFRAAWYNEWFRLFLKAYEPDTKVVYTSSYAFPMEILAACDVIPFDFEVAGSIISSTDMAIPTMEEAEIHGYSRDLCSFHRTDLGAVFKNDFPEPDLLITTSYYCDGKAKTNDILSHMLGKEAFLLYTPREINKDSISYVANQLRQVASKISEVTGQKFDEDRLKETVRQSNQSRNTHLTLLDVLKNRPFPWSGSDFIAYSINGNLFNGRPTREKLDNILLEELKTRIVLGKLRPERHRAYWLAWFPVYPSNLFETLRDNQISVALCENFQMYWEEIDESHPFEGLALKCLANPFIGPTSRRIAGLDSVREAFNIDCAILFATPACRHSKSAFRLIQDSLAARNIPFLMLDIDISDPRGYAPEQIKTRIEAFAEMLDNGHGV
jgi:benzoyl-CoA reductase/2-hydroxyglutaryl-CoA dehydratase subunit BcrC/BadD/HgdB